MAEDDTAAAEGPAGTAERFHPADVAEAGGWAGYRLDEMAGSSVGRIEAVLVDASEGESEPTWIAVRLGRRGRRTALPFESVAAGVGHVWVPYPKRMLLDAPRFDARFGLRSGDELELCDHFGLGPDAPRRLALEGRDENETSSVPAPREE